MLNVIFSVWFTNLLLYVDMVRIIPMDRLDPLHYEQIYELHIHDSLASHECGIVKYQVKRGQPQSTSFVLNLG